MDTLTELEKIENEAQWYDVEKLRNIPIGKDDDFNSVLLSSEDFEWMCQKIRTLVGKLAFKEGQ